MPKPTLKSNPVTFRLLPPEEWERLTPVYEGQGDELPSSDYNTAMVAELDGEIVGMWGLNLIVHAGPLWVSPEFRKRGIATELGRRLHDVIKGRGAKGYLMFASNTITDRIARRLGFTFRDWKVFEKRIED